MCFYLSLFSKIWTILSEIPDTITWSIYLIRKKLAQIAKDGRVLNNLHKAVFLGDEGTKSGSDVYGEEPVLHAEQLEV